MATMGGLLSQQARGEFLLLLNPSPKLGQANLILKVPISLLCTDHKGIQGRIEGYGGYLALDKWHPTPQQHLALACGRMGLVLSSCSIPALFCAFQVLWREQSGSVRF